MWGGHFSFAGDGQANNIACWDSVSWSALGSGNGIDGGYLRVNALTVYGNQLIAAGNFSTAGDQLANNIAAWEGASWSAMGSGTDYDVSALTAYDNKLVAGGNFSIAGGKVSARLATWSKTATDVDDVESSVPATFLLDQNYPNPFNPTTVIKYEVPRSSHVAIDVFDVLGRQIRHLVDEDEHYGLHSVTWDGRDEFGSAVASGVYFYRLKTADRVETKKMLLLK